ncbi:Translation initiation factor eIF-2B subunit alpha [Eumeta japonica]|uniref:Translation initiation factor eIF2B subunit alpha n=1 Tax=Eumeta variegata TaxID=151549 RepID=A0A4C1TLQ2_EUMVA|nr:Translation initiation factor eIF-2B subunit alpha [Eumeta japonica]
MKDKKEEEFCVETAFRKNMRGDVSAGLAAIKTLLNVLENYMYTNAPKDSAAQGGTVQELDLLLKKAAQAIRECGEPVTAISSGCELFMKFITLAKLDTDTFQECMQVMMERGKIFVNRLQKARGKVAEEALPFISDGCKILTHSRSRVVLQAMLEAAKANLRFKVFVTMSGPDNSGIEMHKELEKHGVDVTLILDSAVGYVMEQIDIVMVGAEGVTGNGGIINKVGTYTIGMAAARLKKPVYVLTESFKFSRIYPLNQQDLPNEFKYLAKHLKSENDLSKIHPLVDYTPPAYITLLFTDLGILPPSAVSDELLKLYT